MKEEYFLELMNLARKASAKNEVPVSALIVKNDKIIAKSYNTRHKKNNVSNHAEIMCINKAAKKLKDWRLMDCDLYVTLKPCNMCTEFIKQSRIRNVFYILDKPVDKKEYYRTKIAKTNIRTFETEYAQYLQDFFKNKRDKKRHIWYNLVGD